MNLAKQVTLKNKRVRNLVLSVISAILFSIPWCGGGPVSLFLAFIPLFILSDSTNKKGLFGWSTLTIILWTVITQYWVAYATILGVIAASLVSIVLFAVPFFLFRIVRAKAPKVLAYTVFVTAWVACEYLYLYNEQISHPWLILGNGFAESVKIIQWYEYFGALGGSLWVLVVNLILYESIARKKKSLGITGAVVVIVPMIISLIMYYSYQEKADPISVTIIQPNIDPYTDKFDGMSNYEQDALIQSLMQQAPKDVNYIIAPETAINDNVNIDNTMNSRSVKSYYDFMCSNYPNSELIIGASMHKFYFTEEPPTPTARKTGDIYYDGINGSLQISGDGRAIDSYIKSRLVIGVEMLPYPKIMSKILKSVDLGGMSGALTTQPERTVFKNNFNGKEVSVAAPICYESIYGEYMTEFIPKGAEAIFIITNDGWWRNTFGYKQHFSYARLRAIETRRSIARSANTGISAFINQRGDVVELLDWDKRGVLTGEINLNKKETFYATFGDGVGRVAAYVLALSLLYFVAYINKKKSHLN